jgi:aryl-alcohol dehydrogenase-like predicted oxidoreductase
LCLDVASTAGTTPPRPSGSGILPHTSAESDEIVRRVVEIANELECTPAQVALAWLCGRPWDIIPVLGATSATQLRENLSSGDILLEAQHRQLLDDLTAPALGFSHDTLRRSHVIDATYGDKWAYVDNKLPTQP